MNKVILVLFPFIVFASGETLSIQEHNSIHGYNHRPAIKLKKKQDMHRLHKVDEEELASFVKELTGEEPIQVNLKHKGLYLFYKVKTSSYYLEINALDKTIIKNEKK